MKLIQRIYQIYFGYERENAEKLEEFYDVEIKAQGNPDIRPGKSKMTILEVYSN